MTCDPAAVIFGVDMDGGQRGRVQGAVLGVVEADDGQIAGRGEPEVPDGRQDAEGGLVVERRDRRHPVRPSQEPLDAVGGGCAVPRHDEGLRRGDAEHAGRLGGEAQAHRAERLVALQHDHGRTVGMKLLEVLTDAGHRDHRRRFFGGHRYRPHLANDLELRHSDV